MVSVEGADGDVTFCSLLCLFFVCCVCLGLI